MTPRARLPWALGVALCVACNSRPPLSERITAAEHFPIDEWAAEEAPDNVELLAYVGRHTPSPATRRAAFHLLLETDDPRALEHFREALHRPELATLIVERAPVSKDGFCEALLEHFLSEPIPAHLLPKFEAELMSPMCRPALEARRDEAPQRIDALIAEGR